MENFNTYDPPLKLDDRLEYFIPDDVPFGEVVYRIIKKIGKGTFSTVYLCQMIGEDTQWAMKVHF
jgi:hypothetical protein